MSRLDKAVKQLAECKHPEDQIQRLSLQIRPRTVLRCSDCGAVNYPDQGPSWTRPMLVAHVLGAGSHS